MFNKEKAFEEIKNNLPVFYKDYFIDEGLYQTASVSMMHAIDMLNTYIIDTFANNNIKTAETYRNIPYISFDASDGFYSYSRIADVPQIHLLLGVSSSYTSSEIIEFWKYTAPPSLKINILDELNIYVELETGDLEHTNSLQEEKERYKGEIISADLYQNKRKKVINSDYAIKNNKLYFLDMSKFDTSSPEVILRNIQIDYNMCWKRTGKYIGIPYSDSVGISKIEYNALNKLFLEIASKGPIINPMNKTLSAMFGKDKANSIGVFDAFMRNNPKEYFWSASVPFPEIGEDGRSVQIIGDTIFEYENDILIDSNTAELQAVPHNIANCTYKWQYALNGVWNDFTSGQVGDRFVLPEDSIAFVGREASIRVECTDTDTQKKYYGYTVVNKVDKMKYQPESIVLKGKPLSVFDFVVCFPRGFATPGIGDKDTRMDMYARYLNVIKPAYTNFFLSWMEFIDSESNGGAEAIRPIDDVTENVLNTASELSEDIDVEENIQTPLKDDGESRHTRVTVDVPDMFDYSPGMFTDSDLRWDQPFHIIDESDLDNSHFLDKISLSYNVFPEAPVGLQAKYKLVGKKYAVVVSFFNSGAANEKFPRCSYYEIYRNSTLIKKINVSSDNRDDLITVIDENFTNIKTSIYKVKTVYLDPSKQIKTSHTEETKVIA